MRIINDINEQRKSTLVSTSNYFAPLIENIFINFGGDDKNFGAK